MSLDELRALGVAWCTEAQFAALLDRVAAAEAERDALLRACEPVRRYLAREKGIYGFRDADCDALRAALAASASGVAEPTTKETR